MSGTGEAGVADPPRHRSPSIVSRADAPRHDAASGPETPTDAPAEPTADGERRRPRRFSESVRHIVEALPRLEGGATLPPSERIELIAIVGARLCLALTILLLVMGGGAYLAFSGGGNVAGGTVAAVLLTGAVGGFVSLQKRLKSLGTDDLILLANSWVYIVLSPLVGGVLAILLYVLFISGLVDGDLFPTIVADRAGFGPGGASVVDQQTSEVARVTVEAAENAAFARMAATGSFSDLFGIYAASPADYAKILFWCFLAGYSERFVTNIISQFETGVGQAAGPVSAQVPGQLPAQASTSSPASGRIPGHAPAPTAGPATSREPAGMSNDFGRRTPAPTTERGDGDDG